jgi:hypothetical protein
MIYFFGGSQRPKDLRKPPLRDFFGGCALRWPVERLPWLYLYTSMNLMSTECLQMALGREDEFRRLRVELWHNVRPRFLRVRLWKGVHGLGIGISRRRLRLWIFHCDSFQRYWTYFIVAEL